MSNLSELIVLLQYTGQNIALFCGGLFAGATIYISMTECPPRTSLSLAELLTLSRSIARRTNALLTVLAAVTALTSIIAAIAGSGMPWVAGGITHVLILGYLLTNVRHTAAELEHLHANDPDFEARGEQLTRRRTLQFAVLGFAGLFAQYLFIVSK